MAVRPVPRAGQFTVPTEAQRSGDFSALLSQGVVIYDPLTAVRLANGRVQRQPFAGNIIPPNRISPIAREILNYYPAPNQAGDAQGRNNYISTNARGDDFYTMNYRVDHNLTDKQRFFVRYARNNRTEYRGNWIGEINSANPVGNYLFRINDALNVDHVWTMSPSSLLNVRASWSRFQEPELRQSQGFFEPANLGFPSAATPTSAPTLLSQHRPRSVLRYRIDFRGAPGLGDVLVSADLDLESRSA